MPKSARSRTVNKLHCQTCGKLRMMNAFIAIHAKDGEPAEKASTFPFKLKKFLELIRSKNMIKLPKFYAANCSACGNTTFYQGRNRESKLDVVNT